MKPEEKILIIANQLAKTNCLDIGNLKKEGYTKEEITHYLERKNLHIMNMLHLLYNGKSWTSYSPIYHKSRKIAKKEIRNHDAFFDD